MPQEPRLISTITKEILQDWKKPCAYAKAYMMAMLEIGTLNEKYFLEDARDIVQRFLANAQSWRGEVARRIKAELRGMLKGGK